MHQAPSTLPRPVDASASGTEICQQYFCRNFSYQLSQESKSVMNMTPVSKSKGYKSLTSPGIKRPVRGRTGLWDHIFLTCKTTYAFANNVDIFACKWKLPK